MKKLLILAAAAALVLAASCTKNETVNNVPAEQQHAISYSFYAPRALTKADKDNYASEATLIDGSQFKVYGWAVEWKNGSAQPFDGENGKLFMNWYPVNYKTGGNTDGNSNEYPDGKRYWPAGDEPDQLSFYAYYPSNKGTITAPEGYGNFSFTAEGKAAEQVDFMVSNLAADKTYDNCTPTKGTVALTFNHALTKVQVKFKTTDDIVNNTKANIKITSAKFKNIFKTGKLPVAFSGIGEWTELSDKADFDVYYPKDALTAEASEVTPDNIFLMVPQNMGEQVLEIEWDVEMEGVTTHNKKTLSLKTDLKKADTDDAEAATINWVRNHSVVYTITVGPKPILFTADVTTWEKDETGYFNVLQ